MFKFSYKRKFFLQIKSKETKLDDIGKNNDDKKDELENLFHKSNVHDDEQQKNCFMIIQNLTIIITFKI